VIAAAAIVGGFALYRFRAVPETVPANASPATNGASPAVLPAAGDPGPSTRVTAPLPPEEPAEPPVTASDSAGPEAPPDHEYRAATRPLTPEEMRQEIDPGNEWERAFRKEERDEAWARPLETEIQQSLEPEISMGRFYVSNVECRTTLCEVRLLARGNLQNAELEDFQTRIFQLPWAERLTPALSSGVASGGETYESIWIFEKKPER
jgi:hypothetical protein